MEIAKSELIQSERIKERGKTKMQKLNMNLYPQNSGDLENIDSLLWDMISIYRDGEIKAPTYEDILYQGDRIDALEDRFLQKKKRRLVSKYSEKRYIP